MYILLFFVIFISLLVEFINRKTQPHLFYLSYILMTAACVFRYGQGTDYFGYMYLYNHVDLSSPVYQKDIGFSLLCHWSTQLGISYMRFSSLFGLLTMAISFPFFSKICNKSMMPLFVFYAYIFLIYPMSGIRQGFTLAVLMGILIPLLLKKKYIYYYIILFLASSIHGSLVVCAILPFIKKINFKKNTIIILFIVATVINLLDINLYSFLPFSLPENRGIMLDRTDDNFNFTGKIFRIIIILVYLSIPVRYYKGNLLEIRNIVFVGYLIYSFFSFVGTVAARIEIYFRAFELLLLFLLLYRNYFLRLRPYYFMVVCLYMTLFFKNIKSQIDQGDYVNTSILSYPYVSIFNSEEIEEVRKDDAINLGE